jgi:hypothetical protein
MSELDEVRSLLDQGLSTEAKNASPRYFTARNYRQFLHWHVAPCLCTEQQGHYRDSLAAVAMYESPGVSTQT